MVKGPARRREGKEDLQVIALVCARDIQPAEGELTEIRLSCAKIHYTAADLAFRAR
jgi:hypothetical protein